MDYLDGIDQNKASDWGLCAGKDEFPCHSYILSAISPVLAGLEGTKQREDGKVAIPFKAGLDKAIAQKFLVCVYKRSRVALSVYEAQQLALLSHEWNIKGLAEICDGNLARHALARQASGDTLFEMTAADKKVADYNVLDWAVLAGRCNLITFAPLCELYIIRHFKEVALMCSLAELSNESLYRILLGVYATTAAEAPPGCYECRRSQSREEAKKLRPPDSEDLNEWAAVMNLPHLEGRQEWKFRLPYQTKKSL